MLKPGVCQYAPGRARADGASHSAQPQGELVIDGGTLDHVLGPKNRLEAALAAVCARCGAVVICRSSPSQKAAVVRMMAEYEMSQARAHMRPSKPTLTLSMGRAPVFRGVALAGDGVQHGLGGSAAADARHAGAAGAVSARRAPGMVSGGRKLKACCRDAGGGSGLSAGAGAQAEGRSRGWLRWYKREMRKQAGRMLAIGDGANDVAMIQVPLPRPRAMAARAA